MAKAQVVHLISEQDIEQRRFHRVSEISRLYGLSESEIYRAIYAGELVARKYRSRAWLIELKDAEAWIEANSELSVA